MQEVDISQMSVTELKTLGFDQTITIKKIERNLEVANESLNAILRQLDVRIAEENKAAEKEAKDAADQATKEAEALAADAPPAAPAAPSEGSEPTPPAQS